VTDGVVESEEGRRVGACDYSRAKDDTASAMIQSLSFRNM
jgi:hypothetical protein